MNPALAPAVAISLTFVLQRQMLLCKETKVKGAKEVGGQGLRSKRVSYMI